MRSATISVLSLLMLALALGTTAQAESPGEQARFVNAANRLSHLFIENTGQIFDTDGNTRPDVRYVSGDDRVKLFFTDRGLSYVYVKYQQKTTAADKPAGGGANGAYTLDYSIVTYRMDMELLGMNAKTRIVAEQPSATAVRYYGAGSGDRDVSPEAFQRIRYINVYDNIDLVFYHRDGQLKYDFVVKPGGHVSDIKIRYAGSNSVQNDGAGQVRITNPFGELIEQAPVSYATDAMSTSKSVVQKDIPTAFNVQDGVISFQVDGYVQGAALVIDPGLLWSTFYGGSNADRGTDITTDGAGNAYVTGYTASINFPTVNGVQFVSGGQQDAFVMKINSSGASVAWATFYGGVYQEFANGIALDGSGNVVVGGLTTSTNFPVTNGAYQSALAGSSDAFVIKLNNNGSRIWATLYGGGDSDYGNDVAVDNNGNVLLTGSTLSSNLGGTVGMFQQIPGGSVDGYLVKFSSAGALSWATYIGGSSSEEGNGVGADGTGAIYVTGTTHSSNFPISGGFQTSLNGVNDAYLIKFDATGSRVWATYFGGSSSETGNDIAIGTEIWITGESESTDLPVPASGYRSFLTGNSDAFIARFSSTGALTYGTYIGGSNTDYAEGIAIGGNSVVITGVTSSSNYPVTTNAAQGALSGPSDAFVSKLALKHPSQGYYNNTKVDTLVYSTFFGGSADDFGNGAAMESSGNILMTGWSTSGSIPFGANTIQLSNAGTYDAIVAKFCELDPEITPGGDIVMCLGDSLELDAGAGYSQYYWYPSGETTQKITVRQTGNYVVEVQDANGCFGISRDTVSVLVTDPPVADISIDTISICAGQSAALNASVSFGGSPPFIYLWTPSASVNDPSAANVSATPSATTMYYVTITDTVGCVGTDSVLVIVNPLPTPNAGPDQAICRGSSAVIGTAGVPVNTYSWSPAIGLDDRTLAQPTATPTATTTYVLTETTPEGCSVRDTMILTVNPNVHITPGSGSTINICVGTSLELDAGAGYAVYGWNTTDSTQKITVNAPGVYIVTVEDVNGCIGSDSVIISQYTPPIADAGSDVMECREVDVVLGGNPAAYSGLAPYTYAWSPALGLSDSTAANPVAHPDMSTTYILTVTDAHGCTATDTVVVAITPTPFADAGPDVTNCDGTGVQIGNVATGGSGQYTYRWSPALGLSDSTAAQPIANPFSTAIYVVTVTDNITGCSDVDTVTVNEQLKINLGKDIVTCSNVGVTLSPNATGGTYPISYQWEPANMVNRPTSHSVFAFPTDTTVFTVTVTDGSGCVKRDSIIVYVNPAPTAVTGPSRNICIGSSVVIGDTAYGGVPPYQYLWTPSSGIWATSPNPEVSPDTTTTYTVTVTDSKGCVDTRSVTVVVNPLPYAQITISGPVNFCNGESTVLTATAGFDHYYWSNGQEGQSITVNASGNYYVTVTDANGCQAQSSAVAITVYPTPNPQITAAGSTSFCRGGSVTLNGPAGYDEYLWSNGETTQDITVSQSGNYILNVKSVRGCWGYSAPINVKVYDLPQPIIAAEGPTVFCDGGQVTLDAGLFVSYLWSTGDTTRKITVDQSGMYYVTVKNYEGCEATSNPMTVVELAQLVPEITPDGPITRCEGEEVILDAGEGYGTYSWNTGDTTQTITVTSAGSFSCTVTSGNCSGTTQTVTVNFVPNPVPVVTPNGPLTFCRGGSVTLDAGDGYSSYLWSTGATTRRITVGEGGFYNVTVMNANGCVATSADIEIVVNEIPQPAVYVSGSTEICYGKSVELVTGEGYASYLWSNGATNRRILVTETGTYYVRVVDANGCVGESEKIRVTVSQSFTAQIVADGPTEVCAGETVTLDAGAGYAKYEWSNGDTTRIITLTQSGSCWVKVTNTSGCAAIADPIAVTIFDLPDKPKIVRMGNTLSTVNTTSYQWYLDGNPIPNATGQSYLASQSGAYTVEITDHNGCMSISDPYAFTPVGIEDFSSSPFSLHVYPDPNNGQFTLEAYFETHTAISGKLTNTLGETVMTFDQETVFGAYQKSVNMNQLPEGMYFFHIEAGTRHYMKKIVRQ